MTPYNQLSEPIRRFVRDKGWQALRPIQAAAIVKILSSDDNYILASRTASGKTEAAFLPILSKVDFKEAGVRVLYISPLIALINDQFERVENLCKHLDITVTRWHGESNKSLKESLVKHPNGIVLITPESIEAMFVNKPYNIKHLFSGLRYVIVDEIHSFLGNDRGKQLQSLLARLLQVNESKFSIVGLSATLGDFAEAKRFTGNESKTTVLLDKTPKTISVTFKYFQGNGATIPEDLFKDLYTEVKDSKVLIFPNSRGKTEEVAVNLKKIAERQKGHENYFSHHASVHKEVREYVEFFAKNNTREYFSIACTSTLELGIDIGMVDKVVQIDATNSISSLIQRVGRSGRKEGQASNLIFYATNRWSMLQSIACWLLYNEGFIEPPVASSASYDILLHQTLSIIKSHSGLAIESLMEQLGDNFAFDEIEYAEINEIINHLVEINIVERIRDELIIGVDGEWIVNNKDFYSVFKTEEMFKVMNRGNAIGEIPLSAQIKEDENIYLAARIWKIIGIEEKAKKIEVTPAKDGKKPAFGGEGPAVHKRLREKMLSILYSSDQYDFLDIASANELEIIRNEFIVFKIADFDRDRPLLVKENHLSLFTFTSTKINRTLSFLLSAAGCKTVCLHQESLLELDSTKEEFVTALKLVPGQMENIDRTIVAHLESNPSILGFSKWGSLLPIKYQVKLIKQKAFDLNGTKDFLSNLNLIENFG